MARRTSRKRVRKASEGIVEKRRRLRGATIHGPERKRHGSYGRARTVELTSFLANRQYWSFLYENDPRKREAFFSFFSLVSLLLLETSVIMYCTERRFSALFSQPPDAKPVVPDSSLVSPATPGITSTSVTPTNGVSPVPAAPSAPAPTDSEFVPDLGVRAARRSTPARRSGHLSPDEDADDDELSRFFFLCLAPRSHDKNESAMQVDDEGSFQSRLPRTVAAAAQLVTDDTALGQCQPRSFACIRSFSVPLFLILPTIFLHVSHDCS